MAVLDGERLTLKDVLRVSRDYEEVSLSGYASKKMETSRRLVDNIGKEGRIAYGINTGIGELANVSIPEKDLRRLQLNIVRGHSAGVGDPLPEDVLRAMILLRANGLAKGHSGVRPIIVETLCEMLNHRVHPVVPCKGSVGASGDLAPLAHMSLVMVGEGEAFYKGKQLTGAEAMKGAGLEPIELLAKEGLALINGTALMAAYGCLALEDAYQLIENALVVGALSFEALKASPEPFDARIQALRPHPGQVAVAGNLLKILQESEIIPSHKGPHKVQDAYTLRCMPQVLGACLDVLTQAEGVLNIEINSATDNPLLFPEDEESLSCGNFHGQPLSFIMDFMAIALCSLASFSERRIARLVDGHLSELPPFLTKNSGFNSGLMLAQYTAAALASENKVLSHPASVDSIPTSANQEDFVCMGPAAGEKLFTIIQNVSYVLAIEYVCAAQGLEFLKPLKPGRGVQAAYEVLRRHVPPLVEDRPTAMDFEGIRNILSRGELVRAVEGSVGALSLRS
ncbi:MAG: histidine ammonia-lyase [Thermoplasmata archaeon]